MQDIPPPWPPPEIVNACMFRSPHGAERVIPQRIEPGTERVELVTGGAIYYDDGKSGAILARPGSVFWHLPGELTVHRYPPGSSYECLCLNLAPVGPPRRLVPRHTVWNDVPAAQAFAREIIAHDGAGSLARPAFAAYVYYRNYILRKPILKPSKNVFSD